MDKQPTLKETNSVPSAEKVMATVFWNAKGTLLVHYLKRVSTIHAECYANLLD